MSKNYGNDSQLAEIVKYISDTMKFPIMGAGGGFAPIGTINFFDASIAPQGWLACDGQTYNITDYPELATFYASVHGSANFYGGNGTTTFAVPDLRGEFLRGTGTNGHANQGNGGTLGQHQDGTVIPLVAFDAYPNNTFMYQSSSQTQPSNTDYEIGSSGRRLVNGTAQAESDRSSAYTARPTNTSFLICVKATVSGDPNGHVYSTEEQVVGTWIDGKPIYEKTIDFGALPNATNKTIQHGIANIDRIVELSGNASNGTSTYQLPRAYYTTSYIIDLSAPTKAEISIITNVDYSAFNGTIFMQYTKTTD